MLNSWSDQIKFRIANALSYFERSYDPSACHGEKLYNTIEAKYWEQPDGRASRKAVSQSCHFGSTFGRGCRQQHYTAWTCNGRFVIWRQHLSKFSLLLDSLVLLYTCSKIRLTENVLLLTQP